LGVQCCGCRGGCGDDEQNRGEKALKAGQVNPPENTKVYHSDVIAAYDLDARSGISVFFSVVAIRAGAPL